MPFASKRQLQTCFGRRLSAEAKGKKTKWDCEKWLEETPAAACIPTVVGEPVEKTCRKRKRSASSKELHTYYRGGRGGIYFYAGGVVVYVPQDAKAYVEKNFTVLPASADMKKNQKQ